jgi:hypothetical protein
MANRDQRRAPKSSGPGSAASASSTVLLMKLVVGNRAQLREIRDLGALP